MLWLAIGILALLVLVLAASNIALWMQARDVSIALSSRLEAAARELVDHETKLNLLNGGWAEFQRISAHMNTEILDHGVTISAWREPFDTLRDAQLALLDELDLVKEKLSIPVKRQVKRGPFSKLRAEAEAGEARKQETVNHAG